MEYAHVLRYCIEVSPPSLWEGQVRGGEFLRKVRARGISPDYLVTYEQGRGITRSPAATLFERVEEHFALYHAVPTVDQLQFEVTEAHAAGSLSQGLAQSLTALIAEATAHEPRPESLEWALEQAEALHNQSTVVDVIISASNLVGRDPTRAADLMRGVTLNGKGPVYTSLRRAAPDRWNTYALGQLKGPPAVRTHIKQFDYRTGGLWKGDLCVVSGVTSKGKSFLTCHIARNLFEAGKLVVVCSGEMPTEQYLCRLEGLTLGVDPQRIRMACLKDAHEATRYREMLSAWAESTGGDVVIFDNCQGMRVNRLGDLVHRVEDEHQRKVDMLLIDPLYELSPNRLSGGTSLEWQDIASVGSDVKALGGELGVPVIGTHQVKADGGDNAGPESLKYAKALGDKADWMWVVYNRPDGSWEVKVQKARGSDNGWSFKLYVDINRGMIVEPEIYGESPFQADHQAADVEDF